MTPDALPTDLTTADASPDAPPTPAPNVRRNKLLRQEVAACKQYRRKLSQNWAVSIDYRRGKPFSSQTDEDRVAVPVDWYLTKQKQALLFSQVPAARVNHPPHTTNKDAAGWVFAFEQKINDTLIGAGIETAMDEVLPDCINAAGIGVVMVSREALTEDVTVPAFDMAMLPPDIAAMIQESGMMPDGSPVPTETVPRVLDSRYVVARISPADFLWPINFTGSNFDNAPWVGRSGRISWAEAVTRFKLDPNDKQRYVGEDRLPQDQLTYDVEKDKSTLEEMVSFDEIFYKVQKFDTEAKAFSLIHHVVFVGERDTPVIDEPWQGQQTDEESNQIIGALRYPVRVLTLSYVTDDAIPPSDSSMGRSQVNEINKSRSQMIQQRDHSKPIRWADSNRVDPTIMSALMRGVWQHIIPVQGVGTNVIGEIPRSHMPVENFQFDRTAKNDLTEIWQTGQGATGADVETKGEVDAISGNMQTRIARERAKVGSFFCSIAEVIGGLICIYEDPSSFGEGFTPMVSRTLTYSILADSTVLLDSSQRLKRLMDFVNFTAKSGWVDLEPVLKEVATLSGLDPSVVIKAPEPKPPVEPNISLRLTGTEDMMNPLTLAFLMKSGQAPDPELIEKAKQLIEAAVTPPIPPPGLVPGPDGQPMPGELPPGPPPGAGPSPLPPPPDVGGAHPNWGPMPKINQRTLDREEVK